MKNKFKVLLAVSILMISTNSIARFIDNGYFVTDTKSGLDWLDISFTVAQSALSVYESTINGSLEGWRIAGYKEVFDLASQFDGKDGLYNPYNHDDSVADMNNYFGVGNGELGLSDFIDLFGGTKIYSSGVSLSAWFAVEENDLPPCPVYEPCGYIGAIDFYDQFDSTKIDYIITDTGNSPVQTVIASRGTLVIRNTISVPEPSILILLLIGLFGLGIARRKL